ncbi:hypothetical protein [Kosakonia cowanii]|uniref:hypothetical protein n=1 Tax=Kosakonia cowanii TaxID=208223 RepID=UPI0040640031
MTNNDDLALNLKKQIANANNKGLYPALSINPEEILSLLAERDADKEEIEKLRVSNRILASDAMWKQERIAELEEMADLQRDKIKRLESDFWDEQQLRKVHSEKSFELENENRELKQRNDKDTIWRGKEIGRLNDEVDALKEKCAAAGIKLEVGE